MNYCEKCNVELTNEMEEEGVVSYCGDCGIGYCEECATDQIDTCYECGNEYCNDCMYECQKCLNFFCDDCVRDISNEDFVDKKDLGEWDQYVVCEVCEEKLKNNFKKIKK
jgi:hypothetical protein